MVAASTCTCNESHDELNQIQKLHRGQSLTGRDNNKNPNNILHKSITKTKLS
jgi:hypothetical protein